MELFDVWLRHGLRKASVVNPIPFCSSFMFSYAASEMAFEQLFRPACTSWLRISHVELRASWPLDCSVDLPFVLAAHQLLFSFYGVWYAVSKMLHGRFEVGGRSVRCWFEEVRVSNSF